MPRLPFLSFPTRDRRLLERTILPWLASRPGVEEVLFVGCGWYTAGYRRLFAHKRFVTLDIDPATRRWGSADRHICDSLANLGEHFTPASLDAVVCNGVFGWGLDAREEVEAAFEACHECLREAGVFILGWNDVPEHVPFRLAECDALGRFRRLRVEFAPDGRIDTGTRNRHQYEFFVK